MTRHNRFTICASCEQYIHAPHLRESQWSAYCRGGSWDARDWRAIDRAFLEGGCPEGRWPLVASAAVMTLPGKRQPCSHRLTVSCCQVDCRLTGETCDGCKNDTISVIIPTADEEPADLETTVSTLRASTYGPLEVIIIDDCSKVPVAGAALRNSIRLGATRSRRLGVELAKGRWVYLPDSHMRYEAPGVLRRLMHVARTRGGLAYSGSKGEQSVNTLCDIRWKNGLLECQWVALGADPRPREPVMRTSGMMGASYLIERELLLSAGGWIGLPGGRGSQELAQSLNLTRRGIGIYCVPELAGQVWHKYRGRAGQAPAPVSVPWRQFRLNQAVTHRLMFGDGAWAEFRKAFPAEIAREAEAPHYVALGEQLRAGFVQSDKEYLAGLGGASGMLDLSASAMLETI